MVQKVWRQREKEPHIFLLQKEETHILGNVHMQGRDGQRAGRRRSKIMQDLVDCVREFDLYPKIHKNQLKDFNNGRERKRQSDYILNQSL